MVYLYLNKNQIKTLLLKKSLLGQYEVLFSEKTFQVDLMTEGQINNIDIVASAIKEVLTNLTTKIKDKDIALILPQESFSFFKTEIPMDMAQSAINDFIFDKASASLSINLHEYAFDYLSLDYGQGKKINVYAINQSSLSQIKEIFDLLGLKIITIIPETLTYFELFDKTLRPEKKENIFFGHLNKTGLFAYLYDSYGLIDNNKFSIESTNLKDIETYLKKTTNQLEKDGKKINRLILSGPESANVRQDTFTKNAGAWTNPLKKIVTNFYDNYLKVLTPNEKPFPVLDYDACFGAFIFTSENKNFSLLKKNNKPKTTKIAQMSSPTKKSPIKSEYIIFIASFIASFIFFIIISKLNLNIKLPEFKTRPTPTPTASPTPTQPSPTPTPSYDKSTLKIKVLNGAGVAGKATEVKNILKKDGYQEILTGNADNFEYKKTLIQLKENVSDAYEPIKTIFEDYTTTLEKESLEASATADLIIIIGEDFK